MADIDAAMGVFELARSYSDESCLRSEVHWQCQLHPTTFSESDLLREHAWVVLCSGFREAVVRRVFGHVSLAFCDWESASEIAGVGELCCESAASAFGNRAKLKSILQTARYVDDVGFDSVRAGVLSEPSVYLQRLPMIGPITCWHLAKNLGFNVAKPDRHLVRLSAALGFRDTSELCGSIAIRTGCEVRVVDILLWRFLADGNRPLQLDARLRRNPSASAAS